MLLKREKRQRGQMAPKQAPLIVYIMKRTIDEKEGVEIKTAKEREAIGVHADILYACFC
jgi:hypothetical protein